MHERERIVFRTCKRACGGALTQTKYSRCLCMREWCVLSESLSRSPVWGRSAAAAPAPAVRAERVIYWLDEQIVCNERISTQKTQRKYTHQNRSNTIYTIQLHCPPPPPLHSPGIRTRRRNETTFDLLIPPLSAECESARS